MSKGLSYRDAGVDIDEGDALVEAIKPFARRTLRPEVLAHREAGRRRAARREHRRLALACRIDGDEQRLLRGRVERLHVVGHDQSRIGARGRAQQVAAAAALLAPQIDDGFLQRSCGQRAHPLERFGVRPGYEIFERGLGRRRNLKGQLTRH